MLLSIVVHNHIRIKSAHLFYLVQEWSVKKVSRAREDFISNSFSLFLVFSDEYHTDKIFKNVRNILIIL